MVRGNVDGKWVSLIRFPEILTVCKTKHYLVKQNRTGDFGFRYVLGEDDEGGPPIRVAFTSVRFNHQRTGLVGSFASCSAMHPCRFNIHNMLEGEAFFVGAPFQDEGEVAWADEDDFADAGVVLAAAEGAEVFFVAYDVADGAAEVEVTAAADLVDAGGGDEVVDVVVVDASGQEEAFVHEAAEDGVCEAQRHAQGVCDGALGDSGVLYGMEVGQDVQVTEVGLALGGVVELVWLVWLVRGGYCVFHGLCCGCRAGRCGFAVVSRAHRGQWHWRQCWNIHGLYPSGNDGGTRPKRGFPGTYRRGVKYGRAV